MGNQNFLNHIKAGFSIFSIESFEEKRVIENLSKIAIENGRSCFFFDIVSGLNGINNDYRNNEIDNPISLFDEIKSLPENSIFFVLDFHKFISELEVYRPLKNLIPHLKSFKKHLVMIVPVTTIPIELEKDITIIDFNLPDENELFNVAEKLVKDNQLEIDIEMEVISQAKGLTLAEAENTFALSVIEAKKYDRKIISSGKLQAIKKSGFMEIFEPENIENLGGLKTAVNYINNRKKGFTDNNLSTPKGILLTGIAGSGKTFFGKVTASILGYPLLYLNLANAKGSLVGETQKNINKICKLIDSVSPVVVLIDEVEKQLSGSGGNSGDSGTTDNMIGSILTWMNESQKPHYLIATCNDIQQLLRVSDGAFIRRFDDTFFVGLPSKNERIEIFNIMSKRYNVKLENIDNLAEKTKGYTGAEIEKIVRNSQYDGISTALNNVKPISQQNRDIVNNQIEWAKNNCIIANEIEEKIEKAENARKIDIN